MLLNPAVRPAKDLQDHVGELTTWHSHEPFEFKSEYIAELEALAVMPDGALVNVELKGSGNYTNDYFVGASVGTSNVAVAYVGVQCHGVGDCFDRECDTLPGLQ